jgi:hypothetical protein
VKNPETAQDIEIQKNISPDTLVSVNVAVNESPEGKGKIKKKKGIFG